MKFTPTETVFNTGEQVLISYVRPDNVLISPLNVFNVGAHYVAAR